MTEKQYKIVITTSGTGSRLKQSTQHLNKALLRIGKKAAISYILDNIPIDVPIVVTLGHKKELVREFLLLAHPERSFEFVDVSPFEGRGASLGYSLLQAEKYLQCPFIYIASDTLFSSPLRAPQHNWMGLSKSGRANLYTSVKMGLSGRIEQIYGKGASQYDALYIGLAAVFDFPIFWQELKKLYQQNREDSTLNDTQVFSQMLQKGCEFRAKTVSHWLDIGNLEALQQARKQIVDAFDNLEKSDESIYLFENDFVVKFFNDPSLVQKRVKRAVLLQGLTPKIEKASRHFYRYQYVKGELFSSNPSEKQLKKLLSFCQKKLWIPALLSPEEKSAFARHCENFYYQKTLSRIAESQIVDQEYLIENERVPSLKTCLQKIDWPRLFQGLATKIHGDLHFENILFCNDTFCLLDWRQDFDGLLEYGDCYYDLAKLNHGMILSHEAIRQNHFEIRWEREKISCKLARPDALAHCQKVFFEFLEAHSFDVKKVKVLTALIFLNIAPLHQNPYNLFLHFLGRLSLWREVKNVPTDRCHHQLLTQSQPKSRAGNQKTPHRSSLTEIPR